MSLPSHKDEDLEQDNDIAYTEQYTHDMLQKLDYLWNKYICLIPADPHLMNTYMTDLIEPIRTCPDTLPLNQTLLAQLVQDLTHVIQYENTEHEWNPCALKQELLWCKQLELLLDE